MVLYAYLSIFFRSPVPDHDLLDYFSDSVCIDIVDKLSMIFVSFSTIYIYNSGTVLSEVSVAKKIEPAGMVTGTASLVFFSFPSREKNCGSGHRTQFCWRLCLPLVVKIHILGPKEDLCSVRSLKVKISVLINTFFVRIRYQWNFIHFLFSTLSS